jgi:hypothetical protein
MRATRPLAVVVCGSLAGCGGGGGGGGSNAAPAVEVVSPATSVVVSRGTVVDVSFRLTDADDAATAAVVLDRDGDRATTADAIVLGSALAETGASAVTLRWDTTGVEPGAYTVFATASDGVNPEVARAGPGLVDVRNVAFAQESTAQIRSVAALPDGSCVVAGMFTGSVTLGVGEPGETTLAAAGGPADQDVLLARFAPEGTLAWARRAGGPDAERCDAIAAHPSGAFVVAGLFRSDAVFGPGEPGERTLPVGGTSDLFVAAYDSDGRVRWATAARGNLFVSAAACFDDGSCAVTGNFLGSIVFGAGEATETTLVAPGSPVSYETFVARLAADGSLAWAVQAGGEENDYASGVAALPDGSCVATGVYRGLATFGEGDPAETTFETEGYELYVARYGADGTLAWASSTEAVYGSGPDAPYSAASAVVPGPGGSLLVTGQVIGGEVWFGKGEPNETLLPGTGTYGTSYVARYEGDGTLGWVQRVLDTDLGSTVGVVPTEDGGFAIGGSMQGPTTFDPDGVARTLDSASPADQDVFVARFDADGLLLWARSAGGVDEDRAFSLAGFRDGSLALAGSFHDLVVFGEGDDHEATLGPTTIVRGFVARWNADGDF